MQKIFSIIKRDGLPTRGSMAGEIEVTIKTIQRDIDFMRDRLHLPIVYDQVAGGYRFSAPVTNFPMMEITEAELVSILVAQKAVVQYRGTPFEEPLRSACEKLSRALSSRMTVSWADLDAIVSFRATRLPKQDLETFSVVAEGVRSCREVSFEYQKLGGSAHKPRRVHPLHLACVQDQWYLVGHCLRRSALRTFHMGRMRRARLEDKTFDRPADFSPEKYFKNSFGVFKAEGDHRVRLQFDRFASQLVRERLWHPSQVVQELAGGRIELHLRLSSCVEIEPWILSWGEHVRVVEPAELRRKILRRHEEAAAGYAV